ncbi:MAG: pentapeptide repeat-containing protein, partial [Caulobacteraceae bacterium]|nr:pentapeptide repeat-containing protein [Caulobacteraceae bacterium]
ADLRGAYAANARFLEADLGLAKLDGCDLTDAELEI